VRKPGIVCTMGMVGDKWSFDNFSPMDCHTDSCKSYDLNGGTPDFIRTPLPELINQVEAGTVRVQVGKVLHLDEIAEAHRCMAEKKARGKTVVHVVIIAGSAENLRRVPTDFRFIPTDVST
jgi:NADPH:quinone reductase-like Zn-dependent oxidoreductase